MSSYVIGKKTGFYSETSLSNCLEKHLTECGWVVKREAWCKAGRADIYAARGPNAVLIEVKLSVAKYLDAIEQLKRYAPYFPQAHLGFCCAEDVPDGIARHLADCGIAVVPTSQLSLNRFLDNPPMEAARYIGAQ